MPLPKQHIPHFVFLGIPHPHFIPVIRGPPPRRIRLPHRFHPHTNLFPQALQFPERKHPLHFHQIHLLQLAPALQHLRSQVAVVGQKHESRRAVLQIPHRIHSRRKTTQTVFQGLPAFRVGHRRHYLRRLVQHQINAPFCFLHHAPCGLNPVPGRVRLCSQLGHYPPVHAHLPAQDQLLRVPSRSDPRPRNNLLQPLLHLFVSPALPDGESPAISPLVGEPSARTTDPQCDEDFRKATPMPIQSGIDLMIRGRNPCAVASRRGLAPSFYRSFSPARGHSHIPGLYSQKCRATPVAKQTGKRTHGSHPLARKIESLPLEISALSFFLLLPHRASFQNASGAPPCLQLGVEESVFDGLLLATFPGSASLPPLHSVAAAAFFELSPSPSGIPSLLARGSCPSLLGTGNSPLPTSFVVPMLASFVRLSSTGANPSSLPSASRASASNSFRLGNSSKSLNPNRIKNSFEVLYRIGLPITS